MHERVEPERATKRRRQRLGRQVAPRHVQLFVGEHELLFMRGVAGVEILGQHDARPQYADDGWSVADDMVVWHTVAGFDCTHEARLLRCKQHGHRHCAHRPNQQRGELPLRDAGHGPGNRGDETDDRGCVGRRKLGCFARRHDHCPCRNGHQ